MSLTSLLWSFQGLTQYDQFTWTSNSLAGSNYQMSQTCGIATDPSGKIYYVDDATQLVCLHDYSNALFETLNPNSTQARLGSNLVFKDSSIYYIGTNNRVCRIAWNSGNLSWDASVYLGDEISTNTKIHVENSHQFFYIRAIDNQICMYWESGGSYGFSALNTSFPIASSFTNIDFKNNHVFYIGDDSELHDLFWDGQSWTHNIKPTDLIFNPSQIYARNGNEVFYVSQNDRKLMSSWDNGVTTGFNSLNKYIDPVKPNSPIYYDNDRVYYIDEFNHSHIAFWDACEWLDQPLNKDVSIDNNLNFAVKQNSFFYVNPASSTSILGQELIQSDFVYKRGNDLMMNGIEFRPLGLCYIINLITVDAGLNFHPTPHTNYSIPNYAFGCDVNNPSLYCMDKIKENLDSVAAEGFNSIRFNGFTVEQGVSGMDPTKLYVAVYDIPNSQSLHLELTPSVQARLFEIMDEVYDYCGQIGLKVNHFAGLAGANYYTHAHDAYVDYLGETADHYKDNPDIYCYTYLLEADMKAYQANRLKDKGLICAFTTKCYDAIREKDKKHLITAGVMHEFSTFNWGFGVLKTDFLTRHMYPINCEDDFYCVRRGLKWTDVIARQSKQPWIIGETGLLGTNDALILNDTINWPGIRTEATQKDYGEFIMDYAYESGAAGVQWWQFADNDWGPVYNPTQRYYGFNYWDGTQIVKKEILLTNTFAGLAPIQSCGGLSLPVDYFYEQIANPVHDLQGTVTDSSGKGIEGAIVMAQGNVSSFRYGITDSLGNYRLQTEYGISSVKCSAVGFELQEELQDPLAIDIQDYQLVEVICVHPDELGIEEQDEQDFTQNSGLLIYPNPTDGDVIIDFTDMKSNSSELTIVNSLGQVVFVKRNLVKEFIWNSSSVSPGFYVVMVTDQDNQKRATEILIIH